jgi:hypothetical protein
VTFAPVTSKPVDPPTNADAGLTHLDPQKRAEILRELLSMWRPDANAPGTGATSLPPVTGQQRFRTTNDVETATRFIEERIRNDFVPMAKGCYNDFLRRKPEAEGNVVVGFEIMGDESVGGVVNSAEIRDESTLRDPSLETCLRESFLSVYFDPPPGEAWRPSGFPSTSRTATWSGRPSSIFATGAGRPLRASRDSEGALPGAHFGRR